jgi:guanylate kinase
VIILTGYTSCGKSTIEKELVKLGYTRIITYTSRTMRDYEINHIHYHFIKDKEFMNKINEGFFAETSSYDTINGLAHYGTAKEDISNDKVEVLNVEGLTQLQKDPSLNITSFFIDVNKRTLVKRLKKRGDKRKEYRRRLKRDRIDFKGIEDKVDFVIDGRFRTPHELALEIIEKDRLKSL